MNTSTVTPPRPVVRIHRSLTAASEKRLLLWMAAHTPRRINSDHLTILGLAAMFAAGASYALAATDIRWLWIASTFIVLNWVGDSLDGTLARFRRQQRPRYGFYVDHVVDAVGTLALFAGIAASGLMSPWMAAALVVAYYLLFIEVALATYAVGEFQISAGVFGPTELRLLLIAGNIKAIFGAEAHIAGHTFLFFDIGAACGVIGMIAIFLYQAIRHTVQLYREESL